MSFASFIESVLDNGRTRVIAPAHIGEEERTEVADILTSTERTYRRNLPGNLPDFDLDAGLWAAEMLFRAGQFYAYRDVNAEFVQEALRSPAPDSRTPAAHYSVDFCFRFLPDLFRFAEHAAASDPLLKEISRLLEPWPLSRVGLANATGDTWVDVFEHPALRLMYVDRIIDRHDKRCLADSRVANEVRAAVGAFPDLAAKAMATIKSTNQPMDQDD